MRRATAKMMGSMTTRPASKKIGKPKINDATPSASGARFSPNSLMNASDSVWAPPEVSTRRPSMAPSPTSSATDARVLPKPPVMTETISPSGRPVASAVSSDTMIRT